MVGEDDEVQTLHGPDKLTSQVDEEYDRDLCGPVTGLWLLPLVHVRR